MNQARGAEGHPRHGSEWLAGYQPKSVDPAAWTVVRSFVEGCAAALELGGGSGDRRTVLAVARLAAWAVGEGLGLEVETVLDPDSVERFVAVGIADDRSRATYRSVLRRVGPLLTETAPWEPRPASVARRHVASPYMVVEIDQLRQDALAQPTEFRVRAARVLLAFGAGAGLDGRWVTKVRGGDVAVRDGVVLVSVGAPAPRVVPVLAAWERDVLALAEGPSDLPLVGRSATGKNYAGQLAASFVRGQGRPRLSCPRLRSTWLVTHLAMGTRLPELATAAGLQGITVLSDLLTSVPPLNELEAAIMLRGRS